MSETHQESPDIGPEGPISDPDQEPDGGPPPTDPPEDPLAR
jgi:hypothetical protein